MKKTVVGVNLLVLYMFTSLFGCSSATNVRPNKTTNNSHTDGTIASMQLVKEPSQNTNIKIYDMFYWSQGQKVEAYVTKPVKPGKYPLFVECHGAMWDL